MKQISVIILLLVTCCLPTIFSVDATCYVTAATRVAPGNIITSGATNKNGQIVPIELYSNYIYLQVNINNSAPLNFVLDSAAESSILNERVAKSLNLTLQEVKDLAVGTGEKTHKLSIVSDTALRVGAAEIKPEYIAVLPLDELESYFGRRLDGILGADFFSRYVIEIDYERNIVTLHEPESFRYLGRGEHIPFHLVDNTPAITAKIQVPGRGIIAGDFVVDTGKTGAFTINRPFVERHHLLESVPQSLARKSYGIGGESDQLLGRIDSLQIGSVTIAHPVTEFSQATKGDLSSDKDAGLIGEEVLRRFKVIFDFSRKEMILEPRALITEPSEYDMSGIFLTAEGNDLKTIRAHKVFPNSPASEAGILEGDTLLEVSGKPTSEITLAQLKQMFKQLGQQYTLVLGRNGKKHEVKIKLRRLI